MAQYWRWALGWAHNSTRTFAPTRALPAIVAALLRLRFVTGTAAKETASTIAVAITAYLLLYGAEFTWKVLFRASAERERLQAHDRTDILRQVTEDHQSQIEALGRDLTESRTECIALKAMASSRMDTIRRIIVGVLAELRHNQEVINNAPASLTIMLRDDTWRAATTVDLLLPDALLNRLSDLYLNIAIVKESPKAVTRTGILFGDPNLAVIAQARLSVSTELPELLVDLEKIMGTLVPISGRWPE